jgi:hypothetical protein
MAADPIPIDLRDVPGTSWHGALHVACAPLTAGDRLMVYSPEDPEYLLEAVDLGLRNSLAWTVSRSADGQWIAVVECRGAAPVRGIIDRLERDHLRLDGRLSAALRLVNAGVVHDSTDAVRGFGRALQAHLTIEDDLLLPALMGGRPPSSVEPGGVMLREHGEILQILMAIDACFLCGDPDAGEIGIYLGLLSGTLAKHEHREETQLFPVWAARLAGLPREQRDALDAEIARRLEDAT